LQAKKQRFFWKRIRSAEFEGLKLELIIGIPTTCFLDEDAFSPQSRTATTMDDRSVFLKYTPFPKPISCLWER
jgi:hypothetical protein